MKQITISVQFLVLACLLSACDLGPLARPTPTPLPTATSIPSLTPTFTETPTVTATAIPSVTLTLTPTAVTCPKGTVLQASVNKCFYASRTPKPPEPSYCQHFKYKWACINNGCFWDRTVQLCK